MDSTRAVWHAYSVDEARRVLAANFDVGLTVEEVARRSTLYGKNALDREEKRSVFSTFLAQFKNPLTNILLVAGLVTLGLAEYVDAVVIFISLSINVIMGTLQEERASKAFERLNESQVRHAVVLRDGQRENILAQDLVPGDVVFLEGGWFVPADLRLFESKDVKVNEAALTGEWLAVSKGTEVCATGTALAEQTNMTFMGTLVESGTARGMVVATGSRTEIGEIARSLASIQGQVTPLQENLKKIARFLTVVIVCALVCILVIGLVRGESWNEMFLLGIAIAVSTIPSGLPAALTVVLAIGMETILKRGGLVRNLLAAETLGATTVIMTDKTGTLTEARMKLCALWSYQGVREAFFDPRHDNHALLELAVLGSDAFIEEKSASHELVVHGKPIEKAVVVSALEAGVSRPLLLAEHKRIDHLPFTSARRCAISLHENPSKQTNRLIVSGLPELLLERSTLVRYAGKREHLSPAIRSELEAKLVTEASHGKRVIAVAYKDTSLTAIPQDDDTISSQLHELVFAGFLVFEDPIRNDVRSAIDEVRAAGAQVMMITGDNPETARYIAEKVGIITPGDELVIRGEELDQWHDDDLYAKLQQVRVIARAVPSHKLRVARAFRSNGEVVAMTGDGINDAPALRAASIGVAVGSGTEVAKEAADLILINDSFSIIVAAIEEGRRIIDNLKKIISYLLSTSFSEIILIGASLVAGAPLPLLPAQILWANIVEEGLMSFSFAFEPKDPHVMKRNPRSAISKTILTGDLRTLILLIASVTGALTVTLYFWLLALDVPIEEIRTVMFVALSLDAIFFTFSLKSLDTPLWRIQFFSNKYLLVVFSISIALLFSALLFQPLRDLLSLVPLTPYEKVLLIGVGLFNLALIEGLKYLIFIRPKAAQLTS